MLPRLSLFLSLLYLLASVTPVIAASPISHIEFGRDLSAVATLDSRHGEIVGFIPDRTEAEDVTLRGQFWLSDGRMLKGEVLVRAGEPFMIVVRVDEATLSGVSLMRWQLSAFDDEAILRHEATALCDEYAVDYPEGYRELFADAIGQCRRFVLDGNKLFPPDPDMDGIRYGADYCPFYPGPVEFRGCPNLVRWGTDDPNLPDHAFVCSDLAVQFQGGGSTHSGDFRFGCGDILEREPELYAGLDNAIYLVDDPDNVALIRSAWPQFLEEVSFP
jgi:hypothetical protein